MRRATFVIVLIVLIAGSAGCSTSVADSRPPNSSPAPVEGRVDVGGFELAYECEGSGSPTMVLEAGYNTPGSRAFVGILHDVAQISRVCTYDRAGTGSSDPRPSAAGLTSGDQADELLILLREARIEPPYVLVAHSYGGFISRLFAAKYRSATAGLVLLESSHEDEIQAYRDLYGENSPDADWIDGDDLLDIDATREALQSTARDYGDLPLIVIRAQRYEDVLSEKLWRRTQADLASMSTDSVFAVALDSGHFVQEDNEPVVIAAISAVVEAERSGTALPGCPELFATVAADCPT